MVKARRETFTGQHYIPTSITLCDKVQATQNPVDYFKLFFDENSTSLLVEQSNLYARQNNKTLNATTDEIKLLLAELLLSSIVPVPNKKLYWSYTDHVPKILANSIRRDRFLDLLHNLHFADNSVSSPDYAYKLRPLFDHLSRTFKKPGTIGQHLLIYKSILVIPYGKHYAKKFIRGKPIRFGYKMWAICSE